MTVPRVSNETVEELVRIGVAAAIESSRGRLTDFFPGSPGLALIEGMVRVAERIQANMNAIATTVEQDRLAILGIEKRNANFAVGSVTVTLAGLYLEPFQLPEGFEITIGSVAFETVENLVIPSYTRTGNVAIAAIQPGVLGNINAVVNPVISYSIPPRVASIALDGSTSGGQDTETNEEWEARIRGEIRRRDILISEDDFEQEVVDELGMGSVAVAVGRLKPDRKSYENGYVSVFALKPRGEALNSTELSNLQSSLSRKASMALINVDNLLTMGLDTKVFAKFNGNAAAIAGEIFELLSLYLRPGNLLPGEPILHKAIERRIQDITGIQEGVVAVTLNGFEQPQSLPNRWTIALPRKIDIRLADFQGNEFDYDFLYGTGLVANGEA
ncbi:MAG: hypothetical protein F6K55_03440 [Moorea sp. SIO4A3]|nr:hypothetical protein [Moorena sp. SIO4A3]